MDINRYAYAGNDPVNMSDPLGHGFWDSVKEAFSNIGNAISNALGGGNDAGLGGDGRPLKKTDNGGPKIEKPGTKVGPKTKGGPIGAFIGSILDALFNPSPPTYATKEESENLRKLGSKSFKDALPEAAKNKVPPTWGDGQPTSKGIGWRWADPAKKGETIRIDQGNPNSPWPSQQQSHVTVTSEGKVIGQNGEVLSSKELEEAHVPLSDWKDWTDYFKP